MWLEIESLCNTYSKLRGQHGIKQRGKKKEKGSLFYFHYIVFTISSFYNHQKLEQLFFLTVSSYKALNLLFYDYYFRQVEAFNL